MATTDLKMYIDGLDKLMEQINQAICLIRQKEVGLNGALPLQ
jgi:hypothetical protein